MAIHGSSALLPTVGKEPVSRLLTGALLTVPALLLWMTVGRERLLWISDGLYYLAAVLGLIWAIQAIRRPYSRATLAVIAIAVWFVASIIGDIIWTYQGSVSEDGYPPFPSVADAMYLTGHLFLGMAALLIPTRPLSLLLRGRILLDGVITILALCTFSWYFYLGPMVLDDSTDLLAKLFGIGYPITDIMLVSSMWLLSANCSRPELRRPLRYMLATLTLLVIGHTYYGVSSLYGTYNSYADALYILIYSLAGVTAYELRRVGPTSANFRDDAIRTGVRFSAMQTLAPYALVPCLILLTAWIGTTGETGPLVTGVYIGTGGCFVMVLFRQMIVLQENLQLYRELHTAAGELGQMAVTDPLTGLPNRRPFEEALARHLAGRTEEPVALILADVDHFKSFNDTFGHPAGDQALAKFAVLLRSVLRDEALPARYGGEEFVILLPAAKLDEAERVAERVRAAVEAAPFPHRKLTVSLGVAVGLSGVTAAAALVQAADLALYQAKHGGRNRVVSGGYVEPAPRRVA